MKYEIRGTRYHLDKMDLIEKERWTKMSNGITKCNLHNTMFNVDEEPCWHCFEECKEES